MKQIIKDMRHKRKIRPIYDWESLQESCGWCSNFKATNIGPMCGVGLEIGCVKCEQFSILDSGYGKFEPFAWPAWIANLKGIRASSWHYPQDGNFMVFEK